MATTTTNGVGTDWNTAANWDNGVPTVNDDAVVDHPMNIDGTGATFASLDNNNTITITGTADIVILGGGSIDNSGGTINANNQNVTFKSSNTTKWTWTVDSGTWTDGSGTHTFEYGHLSITAAYSGFNSGTYTFAENMTFDTVSSVVNLTFGTATTVNFTAGKTHILSNGTNNHYLEFLGVVTMSGSSGNEITFTGSDHGGLYINGTGSLNADLDYVVTTDCIYGLFVNSVAAGETCTVDYCTCSGSPNEGFRIANSTIDSFSGNTAHTNGTDGAYCLSGSVVPVVDFTSYSNTSEGLVLCAGCDVIRSKIYGNTSFNLWVPVNADGVDIQSTLIYESASWGAVFQNCGSTTMFNTTIADNGAAIGNVYASFLAGDGIAITNNIIYGSKYGIFSASAGGDLTRP